MSNAPRARYRFGHTEVDTSRFTVRTQGEVAPLEPKAFDVLVYLLERHERVVEKDELLDALWPKYVSQSVLPRSIAKIRKALGDSGDLIETVRGRGYRFAGVVEVLAPPSLTATSATSSASRAVPDKQLAPSPQAGALHNLDGMFVGRARLMSALDAWVATALEGRGRILVISADAGVGKTRTAAELGKLAQERGARTLSARCRDGTAPAFWPWLQLMRDAEPDMSAASSLSAFMGELTRANEPSPEDRFLVFDRVLNRLTRGEQPVVSIIDDVQWADEGSLRLLEFVVEQADRMPFALVVTTRKGASPAVARTIEVVRRLQHGLVVELDELAVDDIGDLVEVVVGSRDDEMAARLHERTGGNPFFVVELLRANLLRGERDGDGQLPTTIKAAIELALGDVEAATRTMLVAVALCDQAVSVPLLAEVLEASSEDVRRCVQEADQSGLLIVEDEQVVLRHDLIREALADSAEPVERRRLHELIGRALLSQARGRQLARVAHHLFAAGGGAAEEARTVAQRAAEHALADMAYEQAADLYGRALEASGPSNTTPSERAELMLARAEALWLGGQEQAARAASIEAAALAREEGSYDLLARAALGLGTDVERERIGDDEQRRLLEEARGGLDADEEPALSALLLGRLANLPPHVDDVRGRQELSAKAVAQARRANNPRVLALALRSHIVALWGPDRLDERLVVAQELVSLAEKSGMLDELATARDAMALVSLAHGDQLAARHQLDELERITGDLARPGRQFRLHWLHTSAAITEGRFEQARSHIDEARRLAYALGDPFAQLLMTLLQATIEYEKGHYEGVAVVPEALASVYPWAGRVRIALGADVLWRKGRIDEAKAMVDSMSLRELSAIPKDEHWFIVMALLAMVTTRLGDQDRAALIEELLLPYRDRHIFNDMLATGRGPASFYLGVLASGLGRYDDALGHFEAAHQQNVRAGIEPGLVRCNVQTARTLIARNASGDAERAARLVAEASDMATRLHLGSQLSLLEPLR